MSEKVKVTQEQAEAIQRLKDEQRKHIEKIKRAPTLYRVNDWERTLLELEVDEIQSALFEGYEVEESFEVGDWVIDEEFDRLIGKITKIEDKVVWASWGGDDEEKYIIKSELRHATPEEIAKEKERRLFADNGREPWELKKGDLLVGKYTRTIYEINSVNSVGNVRYSEEGAYELIYKVKNDYKVACFVEDRKDVAHAE